MRKKQQRNSYTTEFKVKVSLEVIKGQRTINEIATHYGVHSNLVTQWKMDIYLSTLRFVSCGCTIESAGARD